MTKMTAAQEPEPDYYCEGCGGPYGDGPRNGAEYCPKCDAYWPHDPDAAHLAAQIEGADDAG